MKQDILFGLDEGFGDNIEQKVRKQGITEIVQ